jgi:hypothetical protein
VVNLGICGFPSAEAKHRPVIAIIDCLLSNNWVMRICILSLHAADRGNPTGRMLTMEGNC